MLHASQRPPFSDRVVKRSSVPQANGTSSRLATRSTTSSGGKFYEYRGFFLLACGLILVWLTFSFIKPVVVGAIFATVLYPFMIRMAKWRVPTSLKATIVVIGFTIAFLIPFGLLIFLGAQSLLEKVQSIQEAINSGSVSFSVSGIMELFGLGGVYERLMHLVPISQDQFRQLFSRGLQMAGTVLTSVVQNLLADLPVLLLSTIVILFTIFYLLIDGRRAVQFIRENSFFSPRSTDMILSTMNSLCYSVLVASIAAGVVQTALLALACVITGTDGILLISLITFIASFLPVIGTAPVTLFLTAQAFLSGDIFSGIIFLIFVFLIGVSDNVVRPFVLKGGGDLHPLVGFVAAFGALETIGFYGLFIGPVVAGLFFTVLPLVTKSFPQPGKGR